MLIQQHMLILKLEEHYENYQKATGDTKEQQKIANQFIWEVPSGFDFLLV